MSKVYKKLSNTDFKVSEVKELSSDIKGLEQLELLAWQLNTIKKFVAQAQEMKIKTIQIADWYNTRVDIMNDAKIELWLDYKALKKIELPEEFSLENLDLNIIPAIDIKKDE